jgi:hypothetical protein
MKGLVLMLVAACSSPTMNGGHTGSDDASSRPDGSNSGGGGALYPFALGNTWTFDVAAVGAGSTCSPGTFMQSVVSANSIGGRDAFQMTNFCSGAPGPYDYSTPGGDEVDFYYDTAWLVLVDPMLVAGHSWDYANTSYTWKRETSVTVPVGTYDDCWTAEQNVTYTAYLTYCRGVGLVHSYSSDLTGAGWDAQLATVDLH